jgi:predicted PurR-regulated permease PerM
MSLPDRIASPQWSSNSKRLVFAVLAGLVLLALYRVRRLLLPFAMAVVLAYLVEPAVKLITRRTPLPRTATIVLLYVMMIIALISIPVSAISPIVIQVNSLLNNIPSYLRQLGEFLRAPIFISGIEIPIDQLPIEQVYGSLSNNLITIVQTVGSRSISLFGSVASATISTVGWTILVLFLSFYLVKDHESLFRSVVNLVPSDYQYDIQMLSNEISRTWNAFLRGQLFLCLVMGVIVFVLALIIDLPNALLLAIIAGLAEFLPTIGPILAAIPAVLLGLAQANSSWIGNLTSPFWYTVLVLGLYAVIYQLENYYLVPRIIGRHLRLHPLVVILGALAGASVAGLLGILLAAPLLASARLVFRYIFCKLTDQSPFPGVPLAKIEPDDHQLDEEEAS